MQGYILMGVLVLAVIGFVDLIRYIYLTLSLVFSAIIPSRIKNDCKIVIGEVEYDLL
jgi:uncharacterized membrane protein YkvI